MESAWRSPAPPWARERERERGEGGERRAEPDAVGLCGALALGERAERASGGRVESEWERFLSLGFKCRCGEGEKERAGGRGGGRATALSDARGGSRIGFGGGGKEIRRRRRRASVSNATDDNPDGGGRRAAGRLRLRPQ